MRFLLTRSWLKSIGGLCINLSAAWFAVVFITPKLFYKDFIDLIVFLTKTIGFGIFFLLLSVKIDGLIYYDRH